jgi:hypothetical protein
LRHRESLDAKLRLNIKLRPQACLRWCNGGLMSEVATVGELEPDIPSSAIIRLGVLGATNEWLAILRTIMPAELRLEIIAVGEPRSILPAKVSAVECEIALAFLSARSLQPLTDILAMHDHLGFPEIVAIVERSNDAAALALQAFGIKRVVSLDIAAAWLSETIAPLASIALANRLLRRSSQAMKEAPQMNPLLAPDFLPLSVAESRFRAAYLRALMAQAGSRVRAAKGAGVPYRTLCYMLERYGIRDPPNRENELQGT